MPLSQCFVVCLVEVRSDVRSVELALVLLLAIRTWREIRTSVLDCSMTAETERNRCYSNRFSPHQLCSQGKTGKRQAVSLVRFSLPQ